VSQSNDDNRTVWLYAGQKAEDVMTVEATLQLLWRPPGHGFPGFWEYRLTDAAKR
jgi:hypothetical protein